MDGAPAGKPLPAAPTRIAGGVLNGAAAGALWGLVFIVPLLLQDFGSFQISSARYLIFGIVALALLLPNRARVSRRIGRAEWVALLGLGMLGNILYYVLLVTGVQWAGSAPSALIIGLIPVFITLAKSMGARFSFGSNNKTDQTKNPARWFETLRKHDLRPDQLWTPQRP